MTDTDQLTPKLLKQLRQYWQQQHDHAFKGSVRWQESRRVLQLIKPSPADAAPSDESI
jgi:hypothetical protein